jgi:hypothetical protein
MPELRHDGSGCAVVLRCFGVPVSDARIAAWSGDAVAQGRQAVGAGARRLTERDGPSVRHRLSKGATDSWSR